MSKETRYTIEVTEHQLVLISQCVEDCHRFVGGQTGLFYTTSVLDSMDRKAVRKALEDFKYLINGGDNYDWAGNGCQYEPQKRFLAETYCIYREILHQLAIMRPQGHCNVYEGPTLTCSESGPLPIIRKVYEQEEEQEK